MLTSLRSRNIALLILVVLAGQILSFALIWVLAVQPQAERVGSIMARNIAAIALTMDQLDPAARTALVARINQGGAIRILPGTVQPPEDRGFPTALERVFVRAFAREMRRDNVVVWQGGRTGQMWARISMGGVPWWISYERPRGWSPNGALLASFLIAVTLALIGGVLLQRRIAQPLRALAAAADATRADAAPPPLPIDGPDEIASVARSFNAMSARLAEQEADRTFMLAGISHDLRTPLAKLRLALAMVPQIDADTEGVMNRQFERIDAMLTQFLDFARGIDKEVAQRIDLHALATRLGPGLTVEGDQPMFVDAPPIALERALTNLVRNATLYGRPPIVARVVGDPDMVRIAIIDHGDGVPAEMIATLDHPFVRGDSARASDGGTGLGLSIARHIAEGLGGSLTLSNLAEGGFAAELAIPRRCDGETAG